MAHSDLLNALRQITARVSSFLPRLQKYERAQSMVAVDYFNDDPVFHTWTYKLDKAA
jgi:hypothetical protein